MFSPATTILCLFVMMALSTQAGSGPVAPKTADVYTELDKIQAKFINYGFTVAGTAVTAAVITAPLTESKFTEIFAAKSFAFCEKGGVLLWKRSSQVDQFEAISIADSTQSLDFSATVAENLLKFKECLIVPSEIFLATKPHSALVLNKEFIVRIVQEPGKNTAVKIVSAKKGDVISKSLQEGSNVANLVMLKSTSKTPYLFTLKSEPPVFFVPSCANNDIKVAACYIEADTEAALDVLLVESKKSA